MKLPNRYVRDAHIRKNPWGQHSDHWFMPTQDYPVRCPHCNNLCSADFGMELMCPNCRAKWTKAMFRDMCIESKQINQNRAGWRRDELDVLQDKKAGPSIMGLDQTAKPVGDAARNMVGKANAFALRQKRAQEALIKSLRSAGISNILKEKVTGRKL